MSVDRVWQYGVGSSTVPLRGKAKLAYISGPLSHESRIVRILAVAFRPWVEMNHLYSFITEWCILYCIRVFIGKNFNPKEGLFNGAIGTVVEIVYKANQNPNNGHYPHYVLVDFPCYSGVSFDPRYPTWIPVPTLSTYKPAQIYCPLQLSYGRTIHTFQGFQAGPAQHIKRIVCNAGTTKLEGLFPGMFYTALSRATTIGSIDDRSNSAIFFERLTADRIDHLTTGTNGKTYSLIKKREKWITYLHETQRSNIDSQNTSILDKILFMANARYTALDLDEVITR